MNHTATLLADGSVLVVGGMDDSTDAMRTVERFDPASGAWTRAASLGRVRVDHSATRLPDGSVLVVGGRASNEGRDYWAQVERYDPAGNTWHAVAPLHTPRAGHSATLLPDGRVLVAGGINRDGILASAELYDPLKDTWTAAGALHEARFRHSATLLPDGRVLVAGNGTLTAPLTSVELYDPARNSWSSAAPLPQAQNEHAAVLLPDGRVLIAGGVRPGGTRSSGQPITDVAVYDPAADAWTRLPDLQTARSGLRLALLDDGQVLVTGGTGPEGQVLRAVERINVPVAPPPTVTPSVTPPTVTPPPPTLTPTPSATPPGELDVAAVALQVTGADQPNSPLRLVARVERALSPGTCDLGGQVTFSATRAGTPRELGSAPVGADCQAVLQVEALAPGSYVFSAHYSGDERVAAGVSPDVTVQVWGWLFLPGMWR